MIINTLTDKTFLKKIFTFIYKLRYLILIFAFSITLLFAIPKFFNNVNKIKALNLILENHHGITLKKIDKIEYKIFPQPNYEIKDSNISVGKNLLNIKVKNLVIYPNIKGLYASKEITFKKIKFEGNFLGKELNGFYVPKKDKNYLYFNIKNLGIESRVFLDNKKKLFNPKGQLRLKILGDNLLINFNFDKNLELSESVYKNKNIYTKFKGNIDFNPFFYFKLFADIEKINIENIKFEKLYNLIIEEILNNKLNGELSINYSKNKVISNKEINNKIKVKFKNGNIISDIIDLQFDDFFVTMNLNVKKYSSYRNLDYKILIKTKNINQFYKNIGLKKKHLNNEIKLLIKGNINLNAQKYYFNEVVIDQKILKQEKLIKLKSYFDSNAIYLLNNNINKKNTYLFLKEIINSI
tara:strand:+ start:731 stop:1960 length:1230 start_codon:yes stop_codon:yes gene_type:complete